MLLGGEQSVNTARQLGFTFGVALLGSIFSARMTHVLTAGGARPLLGQAISAGQAGTVLAHVPGADRGGLERAISGR